MSDMQIYVTKTVDEKLLIDKLTHFFHQPVDSVAYPLEESRILISLFSYPGEFPLGVQIAWNPQVQLPSPLETTCYLATELDLSAAFEGDGWFRVNPRGQVKEVNQDEWASQASGGLVLSS